MTMAVHVTLLITSCLVCSVSVYIFCCFLCFCLQVCMYMLWTFLFQNQLWSIGILMNCGLLVDLPLSVWIFCVLFCFFTFFLFWLQPWASVSIMPFMSECLSSITLSIVSLPLPFLFLPFISQSPLPSSLCWCQQLPSGLLHTDILAMKKGSPYTGLRQRVLFHLSVHRLSFSVT